MVKVLCLIRLRCYNNAKHLKEKPMEKWIESKQGEVVCAFCGTVLKTITTSGKRTIYSECKKNCKRTK